jgi:hypothetical protein
MGGDYQPNYEAMFNRAISSLAQIDEALGVPEDSCNTTEQTITAIKLLQAKSRDDDAEIARLNDEIRSLSVSWDL